MIRYIFQYGFSMESITVLSLLVFILFVFFEAFIIPRFNTHLAEIDRWQKVIQDEYRYYIRRYTKEPTAKKMIHFFKDRINEEDLQIFPSGEDIILETNFNGEKYELRFVKRAGNYHAEHPKLEDFYVSSFSLIIVLFAMIDFVAKTFELTTDILFFPANLIPTIIAAIISFYCYISDGFWSVVGGGLRYFVVVYLCYLVYSVIRCFKDDGDG